MKHITTFADFLNEGINVKDIKVGTILNFKDGETWKVTKTPGISSGKIFAAPHGDTKKNYVSLPIEFPIDKLEQDVKSLSESQVNEASAFMAKDVAKTVAFLNAEVGDHPGYIFFGDGEDIEDFDKLWKKRKYQEALDMLAKDREIEAQTFDDVKPWVKESVNEGDINLKNISDTDHTRVIKWIGQNLSGTVDVEKSDKGFKVDGSKISSKDKNDLIKYLKSNDYLNESGVSEGYLDKGDGYWTLYIANKDTTIGKTQVPKGTVIGSVGGGNWQSTDGKINTHIAALLDTPDFDKVPNPTWPIVTEFTKEVENWARQTRDLIQRDPSKAQAVINNRVRVITDMRKLLK